MSNTEPRRPTAEQFEAALALADAEGIGIERAMVLQQADQIVPVQQAQFLRANWPEAIEAATRIAQELTDAFNNLNRVFASSGTSIAALAAMAGDMQKREQRRHRHARWQARNYRRR